MMCETNGISLHYTRIGVGGPTLILLHGLSANGSCWAAIARTLASENDTIMPDLRGHGKSSAPDHGYSYEDHADDVAGLINSLGIPAPVLIGHSMGGLVAAVVASLYPGLVRAVILADPTFLEPERQREVWDSEVVDQQRRILDMPPQEVVADLRTRHPRRALPTVEAMAQARLETRLGAFEVLRPPNPDFRRIMASIEVPILLVTAEAGLVSPELAAELQGLNHRVRAALIEQAGHGLIYDQPSQFSAIAQSFLRSMGHVRPAGPTGNYDINLANPAKPPY